MALAVFFIFKQKRKKDIKLLLGLGTVSLVILPVAAMVSCSTIETTLDTEVEKLNISKATKTPTTVVTAAIDSINNSTDAPTKLQNSRLL